MQWKRYLIGTWSWKRLLRSVAFIYLALLVVAVFFAERLIFFPPEPGYMASQEGLQFLETNEEKIAAVYLPPQPGKPVILYSHGNAEDISAAVDLYDEWHAQGLGVLAYDYPSYGLSTGRCTEASCERAAEAAWKFLTVDRKIPAASIVIAGRSVGGGPAVYLASEHRPRGLALMSSFTSAFAVRFPFPIFPRDRFPNLKRIRGIDCPLLVIHGQDDRLIKPSHGQALFDASPAHDKRLILVPGAGHDDVLVVAPELAEAIGDFAAKGGN